MVGVIGSLLYILLLPVLSFFVVEVTKLKLADSIQSWYFLYGALIVCSATVCYLIIRIIQKYWPSLSHAKFQKIAWILFAIIALVLIASAFLMASKMAERSEYSLDDINSVFHLWFLLGSFFAGPSIACGLVLLRSKPINVFSRRTATRYMKAIAYLDRCGQLDKKKFIKVNRIASDEFTVAQLSRQWDDMSIAIAMHGAGEIKQTLRNTFEKGIPWG